MPKQRKDMRLDRTRLLIISTMFELLAQHTFENISVNDICLAASVSRTTFYVHFDDKYQLVVACMEEFRKELDKLFVSGKQPDAISQMVAAIDQERAVFHNLFTGKENRELEHMLQDFLVEQCSAELEKQRSLGITFTVPIHVVSLFFAYGMSGLIVRWVTGTLPISREELVRCLIEMSRADPYSVFR